MAKDDDKVKATQAADKLGGMAGKAAGFLKGRRGAIDDAIERAEGTKESGADGSTKTPPSKKWYE